MHNNRLKPTDRNGRVFASLPTGAGRGGAGRLLILILLLISFQALAQQRSFPTEQKWVDQSGQFSTPQGKISPELSTTNWQESAKNFIAKSLSLKPENLLTETYNESIIGRHISFVQTWQGAPIFGTSAKLNVAPNGRVSSLLYKTVNTQSWPQNSSPITPDRSRVMAVTGNNIISHIAPVWYYAGEGNPVPAIEVEYGSNDGSLHRMVILDENYQVIYSVDKHRHFDDPTDSLVTAYVFLPDPLTTSQRDYKNDYQDWNDSNVFVLDFERVPVDIRVKYDNGLFILDGPYAYIRDVQKPNTAPTTSTSPLFNFSRGQSGFEDVNAFYHIHTYQKYIQSLGVTLGNIPLKVDAHAAGGDDQSEFDFFDKNDLKLLYGTGGVDDAEDADVIIHEYSHFLSYMAAGDNAYGAERLALEEGLCDYFACSYSKALSAYRWEWLYNWDGHNQYWPGRSCVTVKQYPTDLKGNRWADGEFWAGTLMEIEETLGRAKTDRLMLATLYAFGKNISMGTAAELFIKSDSILNGGANYYLIQKKFADHGILQKIIGVEEHAKPLAVKLRVNPSTAIIELPSSSSGNIVLLDMQGRVLMQKAFTTSTVVSLPISGFAAGVYLVQVQLPGQAAVVKMVKE